jgi:hypothetical protein
MHGILETINQSLETQHERKREGKKINEKQKGDHEKRLTSQNDTRPTNPLHHNNHTC